MKAELLLEIGTEEIPAGYQKSGRKSLQDITTEMLKENRIHVDGELETFGTPRRLILIGRGLAVKQEDVINEMTGPPKGVAFDRDGRPTKAAEGFARKQGVSVNELSIIQTAKGEYLYAKRQITGKPTIEILSHSLPKVVEDIPWPKTMRWGSIGFPFVRPIHWILALFNGEIVPFTLAGIKTNNLTYGHRFMAPEAIRVSGAQDYLKKVRERFVVIEQDEREKMVLEKAAAAAGEMGGILGLDPSLLSNVANLVEYPSAVCGHFDEGFLRLPEPVLITPMKEHQKYFPVYDGNENLMPHFVAVNNTLAKSVKVVRKGHERVLKARLSDADFFFNEDRKRPLEGRLEDLKDVIYQAQLGTSYAKVKRFEEVARYLAIMILPGDEEAVGLAARLCKCDLVTQMVQEFPSLQGVMGREYARLEGYPEEICVALYEHYLPERAGGKLPDSRIGAVVGLADRMDSICGCFALGLEPSGTADPFALRRHAIATIRILEAFRWQLPLVDFVEKTLSVLKKEIDFDREGVLAKVMQFFRERYKQLMIRAGYQNEFIEAVIPSDFNHIHLIRARLDQIRTYASRSEEFVALAITFKRIVNILKRQKEDFEVDPGQFQDPCETALWDRFRDLREQIMGHVSKEDYGAALDLLVRLRKPVDDFFDGVEILTRESQALKENRVGMLQHLAGLFLSIADFSKLSI
jgi:glycyl-tRNA synthetase beta chain